MEDVIKFIKDNQDTYIEELKDFLRIPSISTLAENKNDINNAAKFVADKLKQAGLNRVEIFKQKGIRLFMESGWLLPASPQY